MKTYVVGFVLGLVAFAPTVQAALDVIVVTAQRREQNLQEVPISVTAFSGEDLQRQNITSAVDYLALTPNVSYTEDGQQGSRGLGIAVRGVNNLVSGENAFVNSVGIYLDEFSVASVPNQVANPFLPDMERVEVLRGPQGTYFGRNALGGALNLTTRNPTDEFEGSVNAGFESYEAAGEMYNISGVVNAPIANNFKIRGVAMFEDSSGLVENINPTGEDDSGHQYIHLRGKALWDITDDTSLLVTLIYSDEDQGTDENVPSGVLDLDSVDTLGITEAFDPGTGFYPLNRNRLSHDLQETNEIESIVGVINFQHQFSDSQVLKWITGVIDAEQLRLFDNDLIGGVDALVRNNLYEGTSISSELRFESTGEQFDWVVGGLYATDEQDQQNKVGISSDPTAQITVNGITSPGILPPFPEGLGLALNTKAFEVDSYAFFGDFTWHATSQLDVTVGARYTHDEVLNFVQSAGLLGGPTGPPSFTNEFRPAASSETDFDDLSPRLLVRYQVNDDVSVYGSISKGYKAGGSSVGNNTNVGASPAENPPFILPYDEETLWNYELGAKTELLDQRLRLNGAIFFMDWSDLQLEAFRFLTPGDLSTNFEQTTTVRGAEAFGVEIEALAAITDNFTVGGALGYLDTEITSDDTAELTGGFVVDLKGVELPKSPELTFNLFGEYRSEFAANEWWVRVEFIHRDEQYSDIEAVTNQQTTGPSPNSGNVRPLPRGEFPYLAPAHDIFNIRAGMEFGENWSAGVYIQNATDEEYYTGTQENFGISGIRLRPHPRVFGGNVRFKF